MKQRMIVIFPLVLLLAAGAWWMLFPHARNAPASEPVPFTEELAISTDKGDVRIFHVEIARTMEQQEKGLMFRMSLPPDGGMLFQFEGEPRPVRFWMKDTFIPLDMIFISRDGIIKSIHANAEPRSWDGISSVFPVNAVLEIAGGRAAELGIHAGDQVVHPFFQK